MKSQSPRKPVVLFYCFAVVLAGSVLSCGTKKDTLFENISSGRSNIRFVNSIQESDSLNPLENALMYNGGGVAIGDFNNDSLPDVFFTGNQVSNALYLNRGDFVFDDVSAPAGIRRSGVWSNGAAVVDINQDGLQDIYVSTSMKKNSSLISNMLFVHQGLNEDGVPVFKDMAKEYGLEDFGFSVQAAFFDYDNDGDLDMYLAKTMQTSTFTSQVKPIISDGTAANTDRLFRNDFNDSIRHPYFTDVSKQAGIRWEGYALGLAIADLNNDGWKDIYVTNDFIGTDECYVNNRDGTFTNKIQTYFNHTSYNAMGNEVADLNNDGLPDVMALDMAAADNYRHKMNMNGNSYNSMLLLKRQGHNLQYVRNTVQLNQGQRIDSTNVPGDVVFSEIGYYTGIAETDWSWSVLAADFNNDGFKDIAITNGYPKDITDHDFMAFYFQKQKSEQPASSGTSFSADIPQVKIPNYIYEGNETLHYEDRTIDWGLSIPSFSNGAAYADLDRDGDLDYIVSNVNSEPLVFRNNTPSARRFLQFTFGGPEKNRNGIGAHVTLYQGTKKQCVENSPYRGYLSTCEALAHFGLAAGNIDSAVIEWPGGLRETMYNLKANSRVTADVSHAKFGETAPAKVRPLFANVTGQFAPSYLHRQYDKYDFEKQRMLPHMLSMNGPCLAVADVNGDGQDDFFVGGSTLQPNAFFISSPTGKFNKKEFVETPAQAWNDVTGALFFDADNDQDNDLVITSGYHEQPFDTVQFADRFYANDGKGNFKLQADVLPENYKNKFNVKAADVNRDGKLDLFLGQRFVRGQYPAAGSGFIYRNDSQNGQVKFTDITNEVAPALAKIGMITDALWTDFDQDGWVDLIVAGEWMPVTFLKNENGRLVDVTGHSGLETYTGWWNSIVSGDFNDDGRLDYVVGNAGQNSYYKASAAHPVRMYVKDFDGNGSVDPVCSQYAVSRRNDDGTDGTIDEFPVRVKGELIEQVPMLKKRFLSFDSYARATLRDVLPDEMRKDARVLEATELRSCILLNNGGGKFSIVPLPKEAQWSGIFGMLADDFDGDGYVDVLLNGNDFSAEPSLGPYDALHGLLLRGRGDGTFKSCSMNESGVYLPGNGKAIAKLQTKNSSYTVVTSRNQGSLQFFQPQKNTDIQTLPVLRDDMAVVFAGPTGILRREEIYYGSTFLSQSARFVVIPPTATQATITGFSGASRTIMLKTGPGR